MPTQTIVNDITADHELEVLSQIHHNQAVKQRDIARAIGLSLGMTNAILKRLAAKGFIAMRRANARNIHYLVTPDGVDLIAKRSYRYLRRTVGHVVRYKERMLELMRQAAAPPPQGRGVTAVVLVGRSDLDFLVEWCAQHEGLRFRREAWSGPRRARRVPDEFVIASEQVPFDAADGPDRRSGAGWDLHLADVAMGSHPQ